MSPPVFDRVRHAIHRARHSVSLHRKSPTSPPKPQSPWKCLPPNIFIQILSQCDLADIRALLLTNRTLYNRLSSHESAIAQQYLDNRRKRPRHHHQSPPPSLDYDLSDSPPAFDSPCDSISLSPGDDLTFISDLFPPPPPQYSPGAGDRGPEYSFGYLGDLTRCWTTCLRLSYYLAEYVVANHLHTDPLAHRLCASSKTEREVVYSRAVGLLQARLLAPMAYLIFFLESHAAALDDTPTPSPNPKPTPKHPTTHSQKTQQTILHSPPFTETSILLSTHHAMHLLCAAAQRLMAPEIPPTSTAAWLSLLLTTSTLERIVELFVAAKEDEMGVSFVPSGGGVSAGWTKRMEFLWRMRGDWVDFGGGDVDLERERERGFEGDGYGDGYREMVGDRDRERSGSGRVTMPRLGGIWFSAAEKEIWSRGASPHCSEEVPVLYGSGVLLRCGLCNGS